MKCTRRSVALGLATLPLTGFGSSVSFAKSYPERPIKLMVGYAAGGAADILARVTGRKLAEALHQGVIIENHPGAGGNIAAEKLIRAEADGYTLFFAATAQAINKSLYRHLSFDFVREVTPIASVYREPIILSVHPGLKIKNTAEFIEFAKANPRKLSYGTPGIGTVPHVAGELFKNMAHIDIVHVPYKGGAPALNDLAAGQIHSVFMGPAASMGLLKAGRIRALAVTTDERAEALPDVAPISDTLHGYEASQWFGIFGPNHLSNDIVAMLNAATNSILQEADVKSQLAALGGGSYRTTSDEFTKKVNADAEKWAQVIAGLHLDLQ